ncbi:MAG: carbohydrate ABC transporter permease [Firmicutes bacterium]|nr:carbohydrate ABC transporter permease [Bacillota bacterium]
MVITSFKTFSETIVFPPTLWPKEFIWSNYKTVWNSAPFGVYARNSIIVTLGIIVLQMAITIPAAYGFAKFDFKFKELLFAVVLLAFMIPANVTFISVYLLMAKWGLLRTLLPQILPHGASAFSIFLLRQSFMQVPEEIVESARLDGASELRIMLQIMLPMSKPAMVTIALFSFIGHWNAYFWPLVMTDTAEVRPLPIAVAMLRNIEGSLNWELIMAGNVILVIPVIIVYLLMSRKILDAFVYRGIK